MTQEGYKRKLTAILSADVEGYSRLMGEDEDATIRTLTTYRELMATLIQKHRGRVVDSPGDNLLAEFLSVVDAVRCAVEIQEELRVRNAELPENRRMQFRIGINLGDVVEEGERIYGDGVNITARVEGLAEGGGICISGTVYDSIKNKLSLSYESLGEHTVKNITEPVRVYRMRVGPEAAVKPRPRYWHKAALAALVVLVVVAGTWAIWNFYFRPPPMEPASVEKMALPLPDLPSIAVLPFVNMSEDPKQEFLSDGITENIITALSKVPRLFVIARNSTSTYKGKPVKVKQVSEELGVQYVLEGSVQRSADRIRITAQLIDALKGHHLWAERYDRDLTEIFALQDEITLKILKAIQVKLTEGETYRAVPYAGDKQGLDCYLKAMEALGHVQRANIEDLNVARRIAEEAIATCPETLKPYSLMAAIHMMDYWFGTSKSPRESIDKAIKMAQKSLDVDDSRAEVHALLGQLYCLRKEWDKAIAEGERGVALNPSGADVKYWYAATLTYMGRSEEAILLFEKAIRLNPFGPSRYFLSYGHALRATGRFEEAVSAYKKALQREPNNFFAHLNLCATYSMMGLEKEARAEASEVLRLNPKFSLDYLAKVSGFKDQSEIEKIITALRKAGLPDKPPLPLPDKPSIAVLPFTNMSEDPKQEYFSDGITENIITALSKVEKLFVIARNSTFTYKDKPVKVQQVAQDLGVQYVLEGSVQRSADRIRITAQLIDARKGHHLWAERYDRDLKELFALQDEITMKIITALEVTLTEGEQARVAGSGTNNLDAYLKILQARDLKRTQTVENNYKARQLAEEAIKLDPKYAQAYRWLGGTHLIDVWLGATKSPRESLKKAVEFAQKAISLDDSLGGAHGLLGNLYIMTRQYDKGMQEVERAVELEPNGADAHVFLGMGLKYTDRAKEAVPILKKAIRLDPHTPGWYMHVLAGAYRDIEKHEEGIEWGEKAVQRNPKNVLSRVILCSIYGLAGRMDKARAQAKEIMRLNPKFSVERFARTDPQKNQVVKKRYIDALRKAGLK